MSESYLLSAPFESDAEVSSRQASSRLLTLLTSAVNFDLRCSFLLMDIKCSSLIMEQCLSTKAEIERSRVGEPPLLAWRNISVG